MRASISIRCPATVRLSAVISELTATTHIADAAHAWIGLYFYRARIGLSISLLKSDNNRAGCTQSCPFHELTTGVRECNHSNAVACESFRQLRAILLAIPLRLVKPIGCGLLCGGRIGAVRSLLRERRSKVIIEPIQDYN